MKGSRITIKQSFPQWKVNPLAYLLSALLILSGCQTPFNLDEAPGNSQLASVPYQSLQELDLAVTGLYDLLFQTFRMNITFASAWSADDLTNGGCGCKAVFREFDSRSIHPQNPAIKSNWQMAFRIIHHVNAVLINAADIHFPDRATQDHLVGEAYFIRGFMFHYLTRNYGRIPLVLDISRDYEIGLSSFEEIYQQIESDWLKAEAMLPTASNLGATRPNSGSARAFLARLYLDWAGFPVKDESKYTEAAASAKKVIDHASDHGFSLAEDMVSLYSLAGWKNSEAIFTLAYCEPCGLGNRKYGQLGMPGDFGGWQESFAEIRFYEDFPEGYRKDITFHHEIPVDSNGQITTNASDIARMIPWTSFAGDQNPVFRKIVGPFEDEIYNKYQTSRGDIFMRFAEVLLIYAEASGRSGSVPESAWEALNMVRRRAGGLPVHTAAPGVDADPQMGPIEELAYTERKWELAGEFLRWFDLVRLERVEAALGGTARDPRVSIGTRINPDGSTSLLPITQPSVRITGPLNPESYFQPIPPDEILLLPNLGG